MCASSATHLEEQQGMLKFPVRLRYPLFSSIYFLIKKRNYIRRKRRPRCSAPCLFIPRATPRGAIAEASCSYSTSSQGSGERPPAS